MRVAIMHGLLLALCVSAVAGEPGPQALSRYDRLWDYAVLYKHDDGEVMQRLSLAGRLQADAAYFEADSDDSGSEEFEDALWRRFRIGAKATFSHDIVAHAEVDIDLNKMGTDGAYKGLTDAYLGWRPADAYMLKLGKQSAPFTLDGATSSTKLMTLERSIVAENLWFTTEYFTGASVVGAHAQWTTRLSLYSASGDEEFGSFDSGYFALASLGREFAGNTGWEALSLRGDYVYNNPDYSGEVGTRNLEQDNVRLRGLLKRRQADSGLVYRSARMKQFMADLRQAAPSDATVMIVGESGTGKELAARACHDLSPRWDKPFVAVNCGAIPGQLMESELFGHAKGAFTGADRAASGKIRTAEGGTLFLDEIAELPLDLQPKLLRVLESHQVDPVGSTSPVAVDFRLVCATHRDLEKEVTEGRFREDLLYRINVLQLALPPLRERPEDVALLWDHFTLLHAGEEVASEPAMRAELDARSWRGNVRELKNLNQRLVLMRRGDKMTLEDLHRLAPQAGSIAPATPASTAEPGGLPLGPLPESGLSLVELEKEVIRRALAICGGNRSKTAVFLDIPRHVLVYRISKYELGK